MVLSQVNDVLFTCVVSNYRNPMKSSVGLLHDSQNDNRMSIRVMFWNPSTGQLQQETTGMIVK